jgi:hypothetical protein
MVLASVSVMFSALQNPRCIVVGERWVRGNAAPLDPMVVSQDALRKKDHPTIHLAHSQMMLAEHWMSPMSVLNAWLGNHVHPVL